MVLFMQTFTWKNEIVKIDAETGNVVGRLDLNPLLQEAQKRYPYSLPKLTALPLTPKQTHF